MKKINLKKLKEGQIYAEFPVGIEIKLARRNGRKFDRTTITLEKLIKEYSLINLFDDKIFLK